MDIVVPPPARFLDENKNEVPSLDRAVIDKELVETSKPKNEVSASNIASLENNSSAGIQTSKLDKEQRLNITQESEVESEPGSGDDEENNEAVQAPLSESDTKNPPAASTSQADIWSASSSNLCSVVSEGEILIGHQEEPPRAIHRETQSDPHFVRDRSDSDLGSSNSSREENDSGNTSSDSINWTTTEDEDGHGQEVKNRSVNVRKIKLLRRKLPVTTVWKSESDFSKVKSSCESETMSFSARTQGKLKFRQSKHNQIDQTCQLRREVQHLGMSPHIHEVGLYDSKVDKVEYLRRLADQADTSSEDSFNRRCCVATAFTRSIRGIRVKDSQDALKSRQGFIKGPSLNNNGSDPILEN